MATDKKPIADVNKPGTTPATATSRPVIVGHGSALKDPMVNAEASPDESPKSTASPAAAKKVITPLSQEPETDSEGEPATTDNKPKTEAAIENTSPVSDEAVVDAVLDQVNDPKKQQQQNEADQKRAELIEKLVEEKKYFLPIDKVHARRQHRMVVVVLVLAVLLVLGGVAAIDAELIETNITLPFDLIKN